MSAVPWFSVFEVQVIVWRLPIGHFAPAAGAVTVSVAPTMLNVRSLVSEMALFTTEVMRMRAAHDGSEPAVDVTIRDFGPGIPEEHIPRITERFYRIDVETSRTQKGTGLGLSIVKHILTRHNARLTIRSEVGKGAAFSVHLPAA